MYCKQKELQEIFSVGQTFTQKICRLIDANEERYHGFPHIGARYSLVAFADAYKYYRELENGVEIPPFDPLRAGYLLAIRNDVDWRKFEVKGSEKAKSNIEEEIEKWFNYTDMPDDIEVDKLCEIIKKAMLAIVRESEI